MHLSSARLVGRSRLARRGPVALPGRAGSRPLAALRVPVADATRLAYFTVTRHLVLTIATGTTGCVLVLAACCLVSHSLAASPVPYPMKLTRAAHSKQAQRQRAAHVNGSGAGG